MLRFSLLSAPKIFSALADGLQWILAQKGITHLLHYLDLCGSFKGRGIKTERYFHVNLHSTWGASGDVQIGRSFHLFDFPGHQSGHRGKSAVPACEEITQAETRIDSLPPL